MATKKKPDQSDAEISWPQVPTHQTQPRHVQAYDQLRTDASTGQPVLAVARVVEAEEVTPSVVGHVVPPRGAYPVLGATYGPSAPAPVRAQETMNPMSDVVGDGNLKDATRRKLEGATGGQADVEEKQEESSDRSWLGFPSSEANRVAAERQREEAQQDRVASQIARRRDHEEMAALRAARRGPSPHQSELFMDSQSYPVNTLPAREQAELYGISTETETEANLKEDEELEKLRKKPGGYQISDYKSDYDQSGGYQIPEYRSIYD